MVNRRKSDGRPLGPGHANGRAANAAEGEVVSRDVGGVAGMALGVLHIASPFVFVPGNIQNATTLPFPVAYECASGVELGELLSGVESVRAALVAAAQRLERRGVRAIVGACGSFANFQRRLTEAVDIPVFSSILTQVPWLLATVPARQRIAVMFADRRSFTPAMQEQCGISNTQRLVISDCLGIPEFRAMLERPYRLAHAALERAMVRHSKAVIAENPDVGLIVLQCSELSPYAAAIQAATGKAVADVVTLAEWVFSITVRQHYSGFI